MSSSSRILAGAMSGTSADGVDIALVEITGRGLGMSARLLHHHARAYDAPLRESIFAVRNSGSAQLSELATLGREISQAYAAAVNDALREANLKATDLAAVAAHGQTLYHDPPHTIQWFDPSLVAAEVGCPVVSDFRRADCAAGGQGAPLVPFADYILFRHPTRNRVLLNIGGIANLTYIPAGASIDQVIAFDTGPGNCVLDHLMRKSGSAEGFDRDGQLAAQGRANSALVVMTGETRFTVSRPPKSTDIPTVIADFERALAEPLELSRLSLADQLASACEATALAIRTNVRSFTKADEVIASGGGTRNPQLMQAIERKLRIENRDTGAVRVIPLLRTDEFGVPSAAKEAIAFALLGAATLDGIASNVPSATGAKRSVVLGSITPQP